MPKEKEEERIEKAIRSLIKLPENRRCINCNSLGPQYVCTTFMTCVCTTCSGIHREFTHRVKSVSMARFNVEEVSDLQAGGNERARQLYFKDWDPQRNFYPDGSNQHRLRDFIKHVYVDRKYTGERSLEKLSKVRLGDKEDRSASLKSNSLRNTNLRTEEKSFKNSFNEKSHPREENTRFAGLKKSPIRFKVVDNRVHYNGHRSTRRIEGLMLSSINISSENKSPDIKKNENHSINKPPITDVLEDNAPPLKDDESFKAIPRMYIEGSTHNQIITNTTSIDGKQERKEHPSLERPEEENSNSSSMVKTTTNETTCSVDESSAQENKPLTPKMTMLEFLLSELAIPATEPKNDVSEVLHDNKSKLMTQEEISISRVGDSKMAPISNAHIHANLLDAPSPQKFTSSVNNDSINTSYKDSELEAIIMTTASIKQMPLSTNYEATTVSSTRDTIVGEIVESLNRVVSPTNSKEDNFLEVKFSSKTSSMQASKLLDAIDSSPTSGNINSPTKSSHEVLLQETSNKNINCSLNIPLAQQVSIAQHNPSSIVIEANNDSSHKQSSTTLVETNANMRTELPADLFTLNYPTAPQTYSYFQGTSPYRMGFNNMQYHPTVKPMPTYVNSTSSTNPFDVNNGTTTSVVSIMHPQESSYTFSLPSGSYMVPRAHMNMISSRLQGAAGFNNNATYFGNLNTSQQPSSIYSVPTNHFLPSTGGNPFG